MTSKRTVKKAEEPIAVIGIACRLPGDVNSPDQFWDVLTKANPIFTPAPNKRWNTGIPSAPADDGQIQNSSKLPRGAFLSDEQLEMFDPEAFGLSEAEVLDMDPHQRLTLTVCAEALRNAGLRGDQPNFYWDEKAKGVPEEKADIGVFVGIGVAAADAATIALQNPPTPHTNFGYLPFSIANRVNHCLGLRGPSVNIDTACSGSLTAVHYACSSILSGETDTALASGVNIITNPSSYAHINALRILSPHYHSPILTPAVDGYTRGEASIALVLRRLSVAEAEGDRILALLPGSSASHNGRTGRHMATPSLEGQTRVVREAMQRAGVAQEEVGYVEMHATGTQAGDKRELQTVCEVFGAEREGNLVLSGVKSLYGHSEAASGITSLLKAILAIRHASVPPVVHFSTPRTDVELPPHIKIASGGMTPLTPKDGKLRAGVNSFGAGGTNAHVVVESYGGEKDGKLGYPVWEYNLRRYSMTQQRGTYYKTDQVKGWEATKVPEKE